MIIKNKDKFKEKTENYESFIFWSNIILKNYFSNKKEDFNTYFKGNYFEDEIINISDLIKDDLDPVEISDTELDELNKEISF